MSPAEVGGRLQDRLLQEVWGRRQYGAAPDVDRRTAAGTRPVRRLPADDGLAALPEGTRRRLLAAADQVLEGSATILGVTRHDLVSPAWSLDPISGRSFPTDEPAFRIDYRDPGDPRNVKQVWELSRHHHLTLLATAWRLTGDDRYADRVASHLRSWWDANPVMYGVNWASGIELGIRLISWVWTRRLLEGWPGAAALFEENQVAADQVYWHQRFLATFRSRGSSANNHVIAEAAGQLVASCAFPWFPESAGWRDTAGKLLADELAKNTFPTGLNREQASEYHGLVAELGLVAAIEADAAGSPLGPPTWRLLCSMVDALAAVVDCAGNPPRFGDGDDGRALVLADPADNRWTSVLALGAAVFGPLDWWPAVTTDAPALLLAGLLGRKVDGGARPSTRPSHFADAGLTLLRSPAGDDRELWCRADSGPHGFLSIAAHGHADALSFELRESGVEILVDPGTYCYHDHPEWRRYFRSTAAHNTIELDGVDQSESGGPFMWVRTARTTLGDLSLDGPTQRWAAEHDGYDALADPARHHRAIALSPGDRTLEVIDRVRSAGPHRLRLAFHLGPTVDVDLVGNGATLRWKRPDGTEGTAVATLPEALAWRVVRGATDPIEGWYSPGFGHKLPATTLVGSGKLSSAELRTELQFN